MWRLIAFLLFVGAFELCAEPLRVATWDLGLSSRSQPRGADEARLDQFAAVLESLDADIILLQGIPDRETCESLVTRLEGAHYSVAACSKFADVPNSPQVAILARDPVIDARTERWKPEGAVAPSGGFAFAAVQRGTNLLAVYSVQLKDNTVGDQFVADTQLNILQREISAAQLVRRISAINTSLTNQAGATVVGGGFNTNPDVPQFISENTLRVLERAGFKSAFRDEAPELRAAGGNGGGSDTAFDYIFAQNASFPVAPRVTATDLSDHLPLTCELDVHPVVPPINLPTADRPVTLWRLPAIMVTGLVFMFAWWWFVSRKRFYSPALLNDVRFEGLLPFPGDPDDPLSHPGFRHDSGLVTRRLMAAPLHSRIQSLERRALAAEQRAAQATDVVRKGLVPHLARLMKSRLFHGVFSQRTHLLEVQRAGAAQVAELEQRLVRIQSQMQGRIADYERRIAELQKEVLEKDRMNRELLDARLQRINEITEAAAEESVSS